jgi:hypothetical protein
MFSALLFGTNATPEQAAIIVIELLVELTTVGAIVLGIV